ncbi:MAG: hypothetical protein QG657_5217 [Acidobacteriota bacterium]|nr:hypothetical protein [Acidobacteriota bacterium]
MEIVNTKRNFFLFFLKITVANPKIGKKDKKKFCTEKDLTP